MKAIPIDVRTRRAWLRYRIASAIHRLALVMGGTGLGHLLLFGTYATAPVIVPIVTVLFFTWTAVLRCQCPFCDTRVVDGPEVKSWLPFQLGRLPKHCTACEVAVGTPLVHESERRFVARKPRSAPVVSAHTRGLPI